VTGKRVVTGDADTVTLKGRGRVLTKQLSLSSAAEVSSPQAANTSSDKDNR